MNANSALIFRSPLFGRLWLGQALAQTCTRMYQLSVMWWLLTQFSNQAGRISGAFLLFSALPSLMLVKKIGHVVDTHSSRQILIRTDLAMMLLTCLMAALALSAHLEVSLVFLVGFSLAVLQAFYDPTLSKVAPTLVAEKDVEKAVGWMSSTQSIASFAGALAGAVVIERLGLGGVAALASFGYLVSFLCNWGLPKDPARDVSSSEEIKSTFDVLHDLPEIKKILIGFGLVNFFLTPILVVLPLYVAQTLKGTASMLGLMEAALGGGLVLGAFLGGSVNLGKDKLTTGIICLSIIAVCLLVMGLWINAYFYALSLAMLGISLGINNVKFVAYFQEQIDDSIRGRFFAALQATIGFITPAAFGIFGLVADLLSPGPTAILQGLGVGLVVFYFVNLRRGSALARSNEVIS